ncbi:MULTISPECIES: chloride channel protein [unclassified Cyanobium]|uniref:chloride channel protein n=1 Tax=unclassified Cyanobium TaxID=2627006 RepID=UPI0020CCB775|nr:MULTISPECIES: chloride channel protein [unclassified Cyanobium]MCP9834724.1 chloride channel protein [Cyanobium sp. La Preciosa 7G6]MCP9937415.1 chloride channel protein [Cyanobium sp. Aljojuca 7A6]
MTPPPATLGDVQPDGNLRRGQVLALLAAALPLLLLLQPYQWLSALGFRLQRAWPLGEGGGVRGGSLLLVFAGTALLTLLANGPLKGSRGGGLTGVLALQLEPVQQGPARSAALASLDLKRQLARLPLLLLTHGASLTVGLESPSASLGASLLLALRARLAPLRRLPLPVLLAIGAGAGLGMAFNSVLLGVTYAIEELCRRRSAALINGTLLTTGLGVLIGATTGLWQRMAEAAPAHHAGLTLLMGSGGHLIAPALLLTLGAGWLGGLFTACTAWTARRWGQWLSIPARPGGSALPRPLIWALGAALVISLAAVASDGWSLNDGQLLILRMAYGEDRPGLEVLPWRLLASVLSIAIGAPGGVMHDAMSLGALLAGPLIGDLPPLERQLLVWIGATALFSGACRTPLFCALFVAQIAGNGALVPLLLLVAALAAPIGRWVWAATWNEVQLERWLESHEVNMAEKMKED